MLHQRDCFPAPAGCVQGGGMYCNSGGQAGGQPVQLTGVRMLNNSAALGGAIFSYTHCRRVGPRGACGPVCCCCGRRAAPLCMAQACGGRSRADTSAQQPPMSWHALRSLPPCPCSMSLTNCTLQHNSASQHGGGLGAAEGAAVNLTGCALVGNGVPSCSATGSPQVLPRHNAAASALLGSRKPA